MPSEIDYISHMNKKFHNEITEKSRFNLSKAFCQSLSRMHKAKFGADAEVKANFRTLKKIDDLDERQETVHAVRNLVT